jgi:glutaryl-CoA dehydrogenase (non-decarboxylating)
MIFELNEEQLKLRDEFRTFVKEELLGVAEEFDQQGEVPVSFIQKLAKKGYLGATIPEKYGGRGIDQLSYGLLNEEIGRGCSSVRSLITVHSSLTAETILRWGSEDQKTHWLPLLASGQKIAAFGLTEPNTGSDAQNIQSTYEDKQDTYVLNGHKKWITFGQLADVFVIVATGPSGISTFLVDKDTPGVEIKPLQGILGTRASMLAEVILTNCSIPKSRLLGRQGFGFMQIVNTALDNGRYSVACGS